MKIRRSPSRSAASTSASKLGVAKSCTAHPGEHDRGLDPEPTTDVRPEHGHSLPSPVDARDALPELADGARAARCRASHPPARRGSSARRTRPLAALAFFRFLGNLAREGTRT